MSLKNKKTLTLHRDTLKVLERSAQPEKGRTLTTTWLTKPGICGPTMNY